MRIPIVLAIFISSIGPGFARQNSSDFARAEAAFRRLDMDDQLSFKILLTAAGYWVVVATRDFGPKVFDAMTRWQHDNGLVPSGVVDAQLLGSLYRQTLPLWRLWGFRAIGHPTRGRPIWIPMGLGLISSRDRDGLRWTDAEGRVAVSYSYFDGVGVPAGFDAMLSGVAAKAGHVYYRVLREDFFAISASIGASDKYYRCQKDGGGLLCLLLAWRHDAEWLHMERVAILMSGSLWTAMTGAPFAPIPRGEDPPPPASVAVARPPDPPPAQTPKPAQIASSGTGFFVNRAGYVLTNAHVVEDCVRLKATGDKGDSAQATVIARDPSNDLAVLRTFLEPPGVARLRGVVRLGEAVEAFGFPLSDVLASSGNFTLGNVTALAGIGDDSRYLQISTPIQPGNSGGPLLDQSGGVVGVVTSKLNASKLMAANGDIPQNVNFAIKASIAANFLQSNRIDFEPGELGEAMSPPDLADRARAMAVFVECNF